MARDRRAHYGITPDCPGWMYTMFCTCETESVRVFVYQHIATCHLHCLTFLSRVSSTSYTTRFTPHYSHRVFQSYLHHLPIFISQVKRCVTWWAYHISIISPQSTPFIGILIPLPPYCFDVLLFNFSQNYSEKR